MIVCDYRTTLHSIWAAWGQENFGFRATVGADLGMWVFNEDRFANLLNFRK